MKKSFLILTILATFSIAYPADGLAIGDKASDFSLKNIDGKTVSLSDYPDSKGFVVIFTCNHCPFAIAWEDRIIALDKKYKTLGYPVIAINPNDPKIAPGDSYEKMQERAKEKDFSFPYLFDEKQEVYKAYGATRTPHAFVLTKSGDDLIVKYIGTIDDNHQEPTAVQKTYLADALDAVLAGKDPDPNFTKAIGCSIKSK